MSSTDLGVEKVLGALIKPNESAFVVLDSNHSRQHVLRELQIYSSFVNNGSYVIAADGIMAKLVGAPRSSPEWVDDNPQRAVEDFLRTNEDFELVDPAFRFNEGSVQRRVTYWPAAYVRRVRGRDLAQTPAAVPPG